MKSRTTLQLGDLVKDTVTGFKGVIIARTEWLNGCLRVTVQPQGVTKEGKLFESVGFDVEQLELVKSAVAKPCEPSGGPMPEVGRGR